MPLKYNTDELITKAEQAEEANAYDDVKWMYDVLIDDYKKDVEYNNLLEDEIDKLEEEKNKLDENNSENLEKISELELKIFENNEKISQNKLEISDLKSQLEKIFNSEISEISEKILWEKISENFLTTEKKSEILRGSVEKFSESQGKISELEEKISEIKTQRENLLEYNSEITDKDKEKFSELENKIFELEWEKKSLEENFLDIYNFLFKKNISEYSENFSEEILKEIINLVKNNVSFSKGLVRQNKEIENYKKVKETLITVVNNLNSQNANLEFWNSTLQWLLDETVLELDKVFDENEELKNELWVTRWKLIHTIWSAKQSEFIIKQQWDFIRSNLQQINSLELEKWNLENKIKNLKEEVEKWEKNWEKLEEMEVEIGELKKKEVELLAKIKELKTALENEKKKSQEILDENFELKGKMEWLKILSDMWKLTLSETKDISNKADKISNHINGIVDKYKDLLNN